jgi:hypothetical protein
VLHDEEHRAIVIANIVQSSRSSMTTRRGLVWSFLSSS